MEAAEAKTRFAKVAKGEVETVLVRDKSSLDQIASILTHDRNVESSRCDGAHREILQRFTPYYLYSTDSILKFAVFVDDDMIGAFLLHPWNPVLWEVHVSFLPGSHPDTVREGYRQMTVFMKDIIRAEALVAAIPTCNRAARILTISLGAKKTGSIPKAFVKDGVKYDYELWVTHLSPAEGG